MKWTERDIAYLQRWYGRKSACEIAEQLGKTKGSVYQFASAHGLSTPKTQRPSRVMVQRKIRQLHPKGYSDSEIAAVVGCSREWIGEVRRKMGISAHICHERYRARVREKTAEQCRKAGVPNLGTLRAQIHRERAAAAGWPEDLRPRHVQILNLLYDHGPKTRREIAEALGMPWKGSRKSLHSNDPEGSYLAHLMKRGFVVCFRRKVQQGGQGKNVSLYMIPPYVRRGDRHRKANSCQNRTEAAGQSKQSTPAQALPTRSGPRSRKRSQTNACRQSSKRRSARRKKAGPRSKQRKALQAKTRLGNRVRQYLLKHGPTKPAVLAVELEAEPEEIEAELTARPDRFRKGRSGWEAV